MPRDLYFTAVVFSFFFFSMLNLWGHWTGLYQTWTFTYDCYLKIWSEHSRTFTPTGWEQKSLFWDRLWTLIEHISATEHGKKLVNRLELPTCFQNLVNFCPETTENDWRLCAHPTPKFSHWETMPALPYGRRITDSRQILARVSGTSLQSRTTVQNAGRAHVGLCHASSFD